LIEQAAGHSDGQTEERNSDGQTEERNSDRIAQQGDELDRLTKERDALSKK
jgi:hypothetical protein